MTFRERTLALLCFGILAFGALVAARIYSPILVAYVVEESLIQKAPDGGDAGRIRTRFEELINSFPDRHSRLQRLMEMSQYLEKVQRLDAAEVERLLD